MYVEMTNILILVGNNLKEKCRWGTQYNIKAGLKEIRGEIWMCSCGLSDGLCE
jgi:hypothetical protein